MDIQNALASGQSFFLGKITKFFFQRQAIVIISNTTKIDLSSISCQIEPFIVSNFTTASCTANPKAAITAKRNIFGLAESINTSLSAPVVEITAQS